MSIIRSASPRVVRALGAVGARTPRLALALGDLIATLAAPFRSHSWREVRALFPESTPAEARRILRLALRLNFRDQVVAEIAWRRRERLAEIVRVDELNARLRGPVILATFHVGPLQAFRLVAKGNGQESVFVRAYGREEDGAAAFHRAARALARGGVVAIPVDPRHGSRTPARFFGHEVLLARGAFALARVSRAPIVPVVLVWRGYEVYPVAGDPIEAPQDAAARDAFESALATAVAAWLERHLVEHPRDTGLRAIKLFSAHR